MTGRPVDIPAPDEHRGRGRWIALGLGSLAVLGLGVAVGSRIASRQASAPPVTVTVASPAPGHVTAPGRPLGDTGALAGYARTPQGAVAAASAYVSALDGTALLDAERLRELVRSIASVRARDRLVAAYEQVASQAKQRLGVGSVPAPIIIVRAAPVGYRVERYASGVATVSIWRVGIVGSGASVQPQQSWRTETVSLVWEDGGWKVAAFASVPGPTPPLGGSAVSTPGDLFASVPRFREFARADP